MRRALALAALVALCSPHTPSAASRWTMVRSESMTVVGDQSAARLTDVAQQLEQFRAVLGGLIQGARRPLPVPTVVFVFGSRKTMEPFLPLRGGKPASLSGYFHHDADLNYIALSLDGYAGGSELVFHEYTHLLIQNALRVVPVWLNEGLAEYYSTYALRKGAAAADIGRPVERHVLRLREKLMPVADLIAVDDSSELYDEGERRSIFYAESWALTHYLMTEVAGGASQINRYATIVAAGVPPPNAFREAFGATPQDMDKRLQAYVAQPAFKARVYDLREQMKPAGPAGAPQALTDPHAQAWLGDLQRRVGRRDEAARRIEAAAAAKPAPPAASLALALLRLEQQRTIEAWPIFVRAAEEAPEDFLTQYLFGVSVLRYRDGRDGVPSDDRARAALETASRVNPESSETQWWLSYVYMLKPDTLPQARSAIDSALVQAPGRLDYWLRTADIAILEGALDPAEALLKRLAAVRIDKAAAAGAKTRLEAIEEARVRIAAAEAAKRPPPPVVEEPKIDPNAILIALRKVQTGEERAFGDLVKLECDRTGIRFYVQVDDRTLVFRSTRLEDVELIQYVNAPNFTLGCGARTPPDVVYLTFRPGEVPPPPAPPRGTARAAPQARAAADESSGAVVALEFVPKNHVAQK